MNRQHVFIKALVQSNGKNFLNQPVSNTESSSLQGCICFILILKHWTRQVLGVCLQTSCGKPIDVLVLTVCASLIFLAVVTYRITLYAQRDKCPPASIDNLLSMHLLCCIAQMFA